MMEIKITTDLSSVKKQMEQYPEIAAEVQTSKITEAALLLEQVIKLRTPKGAGPIHLRGTIFHKIEAHGASIRGIISTPAKYGLSVERGTKPHMPPEAPIQFWVEKVLGKTGKDAERITAAIRWKIYHEGTFGKHMFGWSLKEQEAAVMAILNKIPAEIIRRIAQ